MNSSPFATVLTTIREPTASVRRLQDMLRGISSQLIVVGDASGPARFESSGAVFLDFCSHHSLDFALSARLPINHYSRKNLGYLWAMAHGFDTIFEIDDDNHPVSLWRPRTLLALAHCVSGSGWVNAYAHFTDELIWPRGFPLSFVNRPVMPDVLDSKCRRVRASIQQCLVNHAPDVDAVWNLLFSNLLPFSFDKQLSIRLRSFSWCPFNSQATWWFHDAFPLLYLPTTCNPRVSDIWRSLIAQRCLWELGEGLVFHAPDMEQVRNPHDLMDDLNAEVPMYLSNAAIAEVLSSLVLNPEKHGVVGNLTACYETLVLAGYITPNELDPLRAWIVDIENYWPVRRTSH